MKKHVMFKMLTFLHMYCMRIKFKNLINGIIISVHSDIFRPLKKKLSIKFKNIFPSLYLHYIHYTYFKKLFYNSKCYMAINYVGIKKYFKI